MKASIVLSLLFAINFSITAQITNQNLYDTVPNMREHYIERLAEFRIEPVVKGKIIFLGNSITEGGQWHQLTDNDSRINRGIGGDVTFGILNRLDDIIVREPAKLFILIGINDISKDFPDAVIINNYKKIIQEIKSKTPSTKIYVQSLLPVNPLYPKFPQHYDKSSHVLSVNKLLKDLAASEKVSFIDLYPLFLDKQNLLDAKLTSDGLHLNAEGYKIWVNYLKDKGYF
jgi:lysophospholipase L1-like esterase